MLNSPCKALCTSSSPIPSFWQLCLIIQGDDVNPADLQLGEGQKEHITQTQQEPSPASSWRLETQQKATSVCFAGGSQQTQNQRQPLNYRYKAVLVGDHWKSSFSFFSFCKNKDGSKDTLKMNVHWLRRTFASDLLKNKELQVLRANIPEWRDSSSLPPRIRDSWKTALSLGSSLKRKENQLKLLIPGPLCSLPGMPVPVYKPKLQWGFSWCP